MPTNILVTSDWQASLHNLRQCEEVVTQLVALQRKHKVDLTVHCGDLKESHNPVDQAVTNFLINSTRRLMEYAPYTVLLGNHDRAGLGDTSVSCAPVLRSAGAKVIDKPTSKFLRQRKQINLSFVPFIRDEHELLQAYDGMTPDGPSVLFFHSEAHGGKQNVYGRESSPVNLHADRHTVCIGGHIHYPQKIGKNVYYVGSPFTQDWSEVNQHKSHLLLTIHDTGDYTVRRIPTRLPGLFDPTCPEFRQPRTWKGSQVRLTIDPVWSPSVVTRKTKEYEKKYPGATIHAVTLPKTSGTVPASTTTSDADAISEYLDATLPPYYGKETTVAFLESLIEESPRSTSHALEIADWSVENVLSFAKYSFKLTSGITLVTGHNYDWGDGDGDQSNGSGKTNFLQAVAIAISGRSLKGQTKDRWAREHTTERALVRFNARLGGQTPLSLTRQRRPHRIALMVGTDDLSSAGGDAERTLGKVLGVSPSAFVNSIYIDQRAINVLLDGNDSARKTYLSEFLGLSRFAKAREEITIRNRQCTDELRACQSQYQNALNLVEVYKENLTNSRRDRAHCESAIKHTEGLLEKLGDPETKDVFFEGAIDQHTDTLSELVQEMGRLKGQLESVDNLLTRFRKLKKAKQCPMCEQPVAATAIDSDHITPLVEERKSLKVQLKESTTAFYKQTAELDKLKAQQKNVQERGRRRVELLERLKGLRNDLRNIEETHTTAKEHFTKCDRSVRLFKDLVDGYKEELDFFQYCWQMLGKNGVPAMLCKRFCESLNASVQTYSDLFSSGEISVEFEVSEDGELDVQVHNKSGSEAIGGQSSGELRLASIIVSLALRETTATSNLLILDEPGEGLDAANASQFCRGLKQVASRFGSVLVTTHNAYIESGLSGDSRTVVIEKRDKVSRMVNA